MPGTSPDVVIPDSLRQAMAGRGADGAGPAGDAWLSALPGRIDEHLHRWDLVPDWSAWHGERALVLPVRRGVERLALKLTWPHSDARFEHLALRAWAGHGAVQLVAADPAASALLLERLDGDRDLTTEPILDACEIIGDLFRELDRPALPQLDRLSDRGTKVKGQLLQGDPAVPRRLTEQAAALLDDLISAPGVDGRLVHTDLHFTNVLAGDRSPWLAIDPKPIAGDWAYAVAPVVWNRPEEAARAHNLRTHLRLRADLVADAAGLDGERVRAWTFVRLVANAVWSAAEPSSDSAFNGRMIAAAKAFAD